MPGTILRNVTGPFISLPFQTPPGHSLALSLAGTSFSATLECTLDLDSTDWVQAGPTFTAATFYNSPVGAVKYRLNIASGTVISAQYSTAPVQVIQTGTGADFTTSIAAAQNAANSAQGAATSARSAIGNLSLAALSTKLQADGPQFVNGSRWIWSASGTINGGTVVADASAGYWNRELTDSTVNARWFGFGLAGNTGAQNKAALQTALNACYAAGGHDLILPDALTTAAIPLASGTVVSSAMRISARGVCCITPSDSATYLLSIRRPSVAGDITAPGQVINGAFVSDEFAMGAGGTLKNVIFRNQLNTAAFTGFAVSIGDAATTPAAAAEGVGFTLDGCAFAGFQTALGLYNNLWLFRADRCDFGANAKHLIDYGQANKGENMTFTRCNFHDSPLAGSIEFQGDQSGAACNFKFSHCSVDYNVTPFLFSGKAYSVEMDSSWLEWGDPSVAGTDTTKNLPQVSAAAGAAGNVLTFRGGAIVYIGATASRLAANGMITGVSILLESPQFVRTRYAPVRNLGFQIVYVNSGATTAYVSVPFAHADKGVPVVIPLNNTGAWWIDAPTTDDNDHFNIVVAVAPGVSGAKFLVRV